MSDEGVAWGPGWSWSAGSCFVKAVSKSNEEAEECHVVVETCRWASGVRQSSWVVGCE